MVTTLTVLSVLPVLTEWVADEQNEETLQDSLQSEGGGWCRSPHVGGGWHKSLWGITTLHQVYIRSSVIYLLNFSNNCISNMFCMQNAMIYVKSEIFLAHYSRCVRALWMLSLWHG